MIKYVCRTEEMSSVDSWVGMVIEMYITVKILNIAK